MHPPAMSTPPTNEGALRGPGEGILDLRGGGLAPQKLCKLPRGPLEEAAGRGNKKLVQQLLSSGAEFGDAFDKASRANEWETVGVMLDHLLARSEDGGGGDARGDNGGAIEALPSTLAMSGALTETLGLAAGKGERRVLKRLLEAGAGVHVGYALHEAVGNRHFKTARLILDDTRGGASALHKFSQTGRAPIHIAAQKGVCATARMLLERGADVDMKTRENDSDGHTALDVAMGCGKWEMTKLLLENKADANARCGSAKRTAAHVAAKRGGTLGLRYLTELINHGADVNIKDAHMRTPMHVAAAGNKHPEHSPGIISKLAAAGGNVHAKNRTGQTPLHVAAVRLQENAVARLLELGADETIKDTRGKKPQEVVGEYVQTHGEIHARIEHLLRTAPLNRVWLRRRWWVMFRSHFTGGRASGGGGGDAAGSAGAAANTGASGGGGGGDCVERPSTRRRVLSPTGTGGSGSDSGAGSSGSGGVSNSSGIIRWVVLDATEGVFREIVTYL